MQITVAFIIMSIARRAPSNYASAIFVSSRHFGKRDAWELWFLDDWLGFRDACRIVWGVLGSSVMFVLRLGCRWGDCGLRRLGLG